MKHFYTFILAALTSVPSLAQQTTLAVATFDNVEGVTLNADSVYNGSTAKATDSVTYESYGSTVTTYYCNFKQGPFTFSQSITPEWGSWTGFAISACKDTTYKSYVLGQYHNVAGGAYEGSSYAVLYGSSDSITVDKGTTLEYVYITNSAFSHHNFAFGDSPASAFTKDGDFFKVTIIGVKDDNTTVTKDVTLANYHDGALDYIDKWEKVDLSELGEVRAIKFAFDGSDKGNWGLNTATYVCLDNLTAAVTNGISNVGYSHDAVEVARYSLNGTRLTAPCKGINIVRMSDGTTRKVIVK